MNASDIETVVLELDASYKVKHEKFENFQYSYFSLNYSRLCRESG